MNNDINIIIKLWNMKEFKEDCSMSGRKLKGKDILTPWKHSKLEGKYMISFYFDESVYNAINFNTLEELIYIYNDASNKNISVEDVQKYMILI